MRKACTDVEWFEDYEVDDEFVGEPVEFTEQNITNFAKQYDPQPFHVDKAAAAESQFRGLIASGSHMFAEIWGGMMRAGFLNNRAMGSPGIDHWRNLKPVRPGDTITLYARVNETRASSSRKDRGYVVFEHSAKNQSGDVVWTFICPQIIARRPADQ